MSLRSFVVWFWGIVFGSGIAAAGTLAVFQDAPKSAPPAMVPPAAPTPVAAIQPLPVPPVPSREERASVRPALAPRPHAAFARASHPASETRRVAELSPESHPAAEMRRVGEISPESHSAAEMRRVADLSGEAKITVVPPIPPEHVPMTLTHDAVAAHANRVVGGPKTERADPNPALFSPRRAQPAWEPPARAYAAPRNYYSRYVYTFSFPYDYQYYPYRYYFSYNY